MNTTVVQYWAFLKFGLRLQHISNSSRGPSESTDTLAAAENAVLERESCNLPHSAKNNLQHSAKNMRNSAAIRFRALLQCIAAETAHHCTD